MSAEENMALARRFIEARVKGDVDAVDEMLAPDYVSHTTQNPGQASRDRPYSGCAREALGKTRLRWCGQRDMLCPWRRPSEIS